VDGYGEDPFGRFDRSFDGYVEDEAVKGAQIPKLSAGNDDTAIGSFAKQAGAKRQIERPGLLTEDASSVCGDAVAAHAILSFWYAARRGDPVSLSRFRAGSPEPPAADGASASSHS
jgi:hypothetical protein